MQSLDKPIALIEARNTGNASRAGENMTQGLANTLFLCVNSRVMMTSNILQRHGIANGTTGIVRDIVYAPGDSAPSLPQYVWVDFGNTYTGPEYFPNDASRRGWVPIHSITANWWTPASTTEGYEEHSREMIPLKCCWAWTIWKAQGMSIKGKVVADLGRSEKEHGLTYTAFSRITNFTNFGLFNGITMNRLITSVFRHKKNGTKEG